LVRLKAVRFRGQAIESFETMEEKRIAWAMTGAGHTLEDCVETLLTFERVDVFLSKAAEEVLRIYRLDARLSASGARIYRETSASSPLVGRLFNGLYRVLVIAPATSNSVAKFVQGISDTLVTNLFAQAGKSRVPILVYPTDLEPEMDSLEPRGESVRVYPRAIDLENTARLKTFAGVHVVDSRKELDHCLSTVVTMGSHEE
jgi:dihydromethanopterin reductase (acceptor)